jgi:hypothetical protein
MVMDAAVTCAQHAIEAEPLSRRSPRPTAHCFALLSVLAAFGVLAFIFSATSPADDDIQQEFCKTSKSAHCAAHYKTASNPHLVSTRAVRSALAPSTSQFPAPFVTARVPVSNGEIKDAAGSSRTGDRSPPVPTLRVLS